jgi:glycerophosphoryl diester phosphodiesterase
MGASFHFWALAGLAALGAGACTSSGVPITIPPPPDPPPFTYGPPGEFLVVSIRGTPLDGTPQGNSLEGLEQALADGIRFVEVDLRRTGDFGIVSSHESLVPGCGELTTMTLDEAKACVLSNGTHLATLDDLLAFDFDGIFLDLKSTETTNAANAESVMLSVIRSVEEADRLETAVAMSYSLAPNVLAVMNDAGLRFGYKGYPAAADAAAFAETALAAGAEMICVEDSVLDPDLVASFLGRGLWILGWSLAPERVDHWRALRDAGMGGLIVSRYAMAHEDLIEAP